MIDSLSTAHRSVGANGVEAQIMDMGDPSSTHHRKVSSSECIAAGAAWLTPSEYDRARDLGWIASDGFGDPGVSGRGAGKIGLQGRRHPPC